MKKEKSMTSLFCHLFILGILIALFFFNESRGSCYGNCYIFESLTYALTQIFCIIGGVLTLIHLVTSQASIRSPKTGSLITSVLWGLFHTGGLVFCLRNAFPYIIRNDPLYAGNLTILLIGALIFLILLGLRIRKIILVLRESSENPE